MFSGCVGYVESSLRMEGAGSLCGLVQFDNVRSGKQAIGDRQGTTWEPRSKPVYFDLISAHLAGNLQPAPSPKTGLTVEVRQNGRTAPPPLSLNSQATTSAGGTPAASWAWGQEAASLGTPRSEAVGHASLVLEHIEFGDAVPSGSASPRRAPANGGTTPRGGAGASPSPALRKMSNPSSTEAPWTPRQASTPRGGSRNSDDPAIADAIKARDWLQAAVRSNKQGDLETAIELAHSIKFPESDPDLVMAVRLYDIIFNKVAQRRAIAAEQRAMGKLIKATAREDENAHFTGGTPRDQRVATFESAIEAGEKARDLCQQAGLAKAERKLQTAVRAVSSSWRAMALAKLRKALVGDSLEGLRGAVVELESALAAGGSDFADCEEVQEEIANARSLCRSKDSFLQAAVRAGIRKKLQIIFGEPGPGKRLGDNLGLGEGGKPADRLPPVSLMREVLLECEQACYLPNDAEGYPVKAMQRALDVTLQRHQSRWCLLCFGYLVFRTGKRAVQGKGEPDKLGIGWLHSSVATSEEAGLPIYQLEKFEKMANEATVLHQQGLSEAAQLVREDISPLRIAHKGVTAASKNLKDAIDSRDVDKIRDAAVQCAIAYNRMTSTTGKPQDGQTLPNKLAARVAQAEELIMQQDFKKQIITSATASDVKGFISLFQQWKDKKLDEQDIIDNPDVKALFDKMSVKAGDKCAQILKKALTFETDSEKMHAQSVPTVDKLADVMKGNQLLSFQIDGHSFHRKPAQAVSLSLARAESVKDALEAAGVQNVLLTKGWGSRHPTIKQPVVRVFPVQRGDPPPAMPTTPSMRPTTPSRR